MRPQGLNDAFDRVVRRLHELAPFGVDVHPYLVFLNTGVVLAFALVPVYAALVTPVAVWAYAAIFLVVVLGYETVYTPVKRRLIGTEERNFPLDPLVYMLPVGLGLVVAAGLDVDAIAPLAALQLAVANGCTRVGCFVGGCCYGRAAPIGVHYPEAVFTDHDGFQRFSPGTDPGTRVWPCQLVEMAGQFLLAGGLFAALLAGVRPRFALLVAYLCGYAVLRFANDFTRAYTHRPTYGPFTEGQVISLALLAVGGPYLLLA